MSKWLLVIGMLFGIPAYSQVNLQTGAAELGYPLFQYEDAKSRLSTAVAINYISGSGLRANDIASCVGTGWDSTSNISGGFAFIE